MFASLFIQSNMCLCLKVSKGANASHMLSWPFKEVYWHLSERKSRLRYWKPVTGFHLCTSEYLCWS